MNGEIGSKRCQLVGGRLVGEGEDHVGESYTRVKAHALLKTRLI